MHESAFPAARLATAIPFTEQCSSHTIRHCVSQSLGPCLRMPRPTTTSRRLASALLLACSTADAWTSNFADTTLNVSQVAVAQPESAGRFLGSPSLVRLPSGVLLASHDEFGPGTARGQRTAFVRASRDGGQTWADSGTGATAIADMYWATLFVRAGDAAVYLLGVSNDGNVAGEPAQATISRSVDEGATWTSPAVRLTAASNASFSTGPTPVLLAGGRLWRALEHNVGPGWASGYLLYVRFVRGKSVVPRKS